MTNRRWVRVGCTSMFSGKIAFAVPYWKLVMLFCAQAARIDAGRNGFEHWTVRLAFLAAPGLGEKREATWP